MKQKSRGIPIYIYQKFNFDFQIKKIDRLRILVVWKYCDVVNSKDRICEGNYSVGGVKKPHPREWYQKVYGRDVNTPFWGVSCPTKEQGKTHLDQGCKCSLLQNVVYITLKCYMQFPKCTPPKIQPRYVVSEKCSLRKYSLDIQSPQNVVYTCSFRKMQPRYVGSENVDYIFQSQSILGRITAIFATLIQT